MSKKSRKHQRTEPENTYIIRCTTIREITDSVKFRVWHELRSWECVWFSDVKTRVQYFVLKHPRDHHIRAPYMRRLAAGRYNVRWKMAGELRIHPSLTVRGYWPAERQREWEARRTRRDQRRDQVRIGRQMQSNDLYRLQTHLRELEKKDMLPIPQNPQPPSPLTQEQRAEQLRQWLSHPHGVFRDLGMGWTWTDIIRAMLDDPNMDPVQYMMGLEEEDLRQRDSEGDALPGSRVPMIGHRTEQGVSENNE